MRLTFSILLLSAAVLLVLHPALQPVAADLRERVGPLPDGSFLLNSGWRLRPAGSQIEVDTLPMSVAVAPDGKHLLVLNGGYNPPSLSVLDLDAGREVSRSPVPDAWLGLSVAPRSDKVYVGGGSQAAVFELVYQPGRLAAGRTFAAISPEKRTVRDFIGDVALSPDGRTLYAADLYNDSIAVFNPQSGKLVERHKTGRRPYRILFHPDGESFFVTSWTDGTLLHHDARTGGVLERLRLGAHASDMAWGAGLPPDEDGRREFPLRLYVAAANTNNVYVVGVSESKALRLLEVINVAMTPRQPAGMTPSAVALSPDQKRLFVVCSDANAVAVVDVSEARSHVLGFIPTGWYPTAAKVLADGTLVVLNGKGVRSHPNPNGPNPTRRVRPEQAGQAGSQYVARIQTGSVQLVPPFSEDQLQAYTATVLANSPYQDARLIDAGVPPGNPIPNRPGEGSPIEHVIYIVKENRTYDQVLGDMKEGNGDPSLCLFGEEVTPNHHKLAREFVLLDNFYVNADVSADGHQWSAAAIAPDYVQKLWPNSYARRRRLNDYQGQEPTATPPAGYLWTNAAAAGVSLRNYGHFVTNRDQPAADGTQVLAVRDPVLARVTNLRFRGFDVDYPDVERAKVFLDELAEFERTGRMPQLILMRLGNDHTAGLAPGRIAPRSAVADNDYALGMIVEGVSRSRFWPKTAIFVVEDDAQNGPDHVDSHRAPAFVISPYARRRVVDSTMYNTTSVLRTIELILGLHPMTHFDAAARPMASAFQATPDLKPYQAEKPRIRLDERNPADSPLARRSARLNFSQADLIEDEELNQILWLALRAAPAPAPTRSFFTR